MDFSTIDQKVYWRCNVRDTVPELFRPIACGVREVMHPGISTQNWKPGFLLMLYAHSPMCFSLGNGMQHMPAGTCCFLQSNKTIQYGNPDTNWIHSWFVIAGEDAVRLPERLNLPVYQTFLYPDESALVFSMQSMYSDLVCNRDHAFRLTFEAQMSRFADSLKNKTAIPQPLQAAEQMMRTTLSARNSIRSFAEKAGMSESYFRSQFQIYYRKTPTEYLTELRIEMAKFLLQEKTSSCKEIASLCGFEDQMYFSRVFRLSTGMSPSDYRKSF